MTITASSVAGVCLGTGLAYLTSVVLYALVAVDFPASSHKTRQYAVEHYRHRSTASLMYRLVPAACTLLTTGVLVNVYAQQANLSSLTLLGLALATATNNGRNVVDPARSLSNPKNSSSPEGAVLDQISRGHAMDLVGFVAMGLCWALW